MSDVIIKVVVDTGWHAGDHVDYLNIDKKEWDGYTKEGKNKLLNQLASDALHFYCSSSAFVVESEDE